VLPQAASVRAVSKTLAAGVEMAFENEIIEHMIVAPYGGQRLAMLCCEQIEINHQLGGVERHHAWQRIVRTVQQAAVPCLFFEQGAQDLAAAIDLGHGRDVTQQATAIVWVVHQARKQAEARHARSLRAAVEIDVLA
jgi:hypothetical protein